MTEPSDPTISNQQQKLWPAPSVSGAGPGLERDGQRLADLHPLKPGMGYRMSVEQYRSQTYLFRRFSLVPATGATTLMEMAAFHMRAKSGLGLNAGPIRTLRHIPLSRHHQALRWHLRTYSVSRKNNSGGNEPRVSLQRAKSPPPGQSGGSGA